MTFSDSKNEHKKSTEQWQLSNATHKKLIAISNILYTYSKPKNTWAQRLLGGHDNGSRR